MTTFSLADMERLLQAEEEIKQLGEFILAREEAFVALTNPDRPDRGCGKWVENPLRTEIRKTLTGEEVKVLVITESLGGDRFGSDAAIHYLPVDFVFSDGTWEKNYEAARAASFTYAGFASGHKHYGN